MKQICTSNTVELHIDYLRSINYAALLNGSKIITSFAIKNLGISVIKRLNVKIQGYYVRKSQEDVGEIGSRETRTVSIEMLPDLKSLLTLNEALFTEFQVVVSDGDKVLATFCFPLIIQAWNYWTGNPSEVGSFVMPNHPYVIHIIEKATSILKEQSRFASFSGNNVADYGDVVEQVRAIWEALLSEKLNYLTSSVNYIDSGQRVLTPDMIARNRHGNCLDLSLLLCSCLERVGLASCLVFIPGHVVAGVWINTDCQVTTSVTKASALIMDRATGDAPSLLVMESTAICSGDKFDDAVMAALSQLEGTSIDFTVDIINSRKEGVRSLTANLEALPLYEDIEIKGCVMPTEESSRRRGWERKLLDLTLRNDMLNLKLGKTIMAIRENDTAKVVEHIKEGSLAEIVGRPDMDNLEQLKNLYRASRTSLEENGANSLFVSLGTLRWYDIDDPRPHIAPLVFIPVNIVRKKAMTYEVHLREDDAMVNVTLIEMLRQMFGVAFPELETMPVDGEGFPEWQKVFAIFSSHITEINKDQPHDRQWELPIHSYIGIFSFTKFLMWHDIHYHPEVIEQHPVLQGMLSYRYQPDYNSRSVEESIEDIYPLDLMLPIDYDSSQLEAVAGSHAGQSFVLHGPPGTGKSQTITNIIADALYAGKRVLFVAEKKAALDVVRTRLDALNLTPYCLELHSNKVDKRSFFAQIKGSNILNFNTRKESEGPSSDYLLKAETLTSLQRHLHEIAEAIHSAREYGLSLYDCINNLLAANYHDLSISYADVKHLSPAQIDELCSEYRSLDLVAQIIGYHPCSSSLVGLYPRENTANNQNAVTELLGQMPAAIADARKKAASFINRWFSKHSPEEILEQNVLWQRVHELAVIDHEKCDDIDTFENYIQRWNSAISELRRWYHFSEKATEIINYDFPKALNHYLQGKGGKQTAEAIISGYYRSLAYYAIDNDSSLRGFSGRLHGGKISRYRIISDDFQKLRRIELSRKMEQQIVEARLTSEEEKQLTVLLRRMQTNGRGIALRKIISESYDVLGKLFPCMLMSPLSVAQYLDMKPGQFDIVIFDEASQMETPDAVGTIARGLSLVVVGDPLQLPPTRFFTSMSSTGEDYEESEDSNSILEDCIALGLPSRYLSRHYRSRHESLIAFSNYHFYDNRLLTFPSHNDSERKVSLINPSGVYDYGKTRVNRIEAEAVVKYVLNILEKCDSAPSIGIVAFSKAQSNLIEDILNTKLQRNKNLQNKLDKATEPLFVKNLENVQGDERDIIIFSIGYGPDKNGNVSLNFGPLNQSGGERRLNVAVSRARQEMIVFSSLLPHHIPADGISSRGVAELRNFLAYAIDGKICQDHISKYEKDVIVDDIAEKLRIKGFNVVTKVGRSEFKIDLAVVDEGDQEKYCLGIILDGVEYNKLPTVRDREITIPTALQSLGWHLHRIWVIDWLENPEAVISEISVLLSHNPQTE